MSLVAPHARVREVARLPRAAPWRVEVVAVLLGVALVVPGFVVWLLEGLPPWGSYGQCSGRVSWAFFCLLPHGVVVGTVHVGAL